MPNDKIETLQPEQVLAVRQLLEGGMRFQETKTLLREYFIRTRGVIFGQDHHDQWFIMHVGGATLESSHPTWVQALGHLLDLPLTEEAKNA